MERNCREVVYDYLHATAYQGTPLARSVFGTEASVAKLTSKDLHGFVENFFKAPRVVLAAAGSEFRRDVDDRINA